MHGENLEPARDKYGELIGRVHDRQELNDLIAQMISELSALHASVVGGDMRRGADQVQTASPRALLLERRAAGGRLCCPTYLSIDPDRPDRRSPLARPGVDIGEGDVLLAINGHELLPTPTPATCFATRVGKQVLLRVIPKGSGTARCRRETHHLAAGTSDSPL